MSRSTRFPALALALGLACSGGSPVTQPVVGADAFLSQPPGTGFRGGDLASSSGGAGAPTAAPAAEPSPASSTREVVEADLYARTGDTLYVLNAYRGLQIVDVADPAAPRLVGRVPVTGTPVDLYLRGTTAFVTVSDAFSALPVDGGGLRPYRGSRLLAVDVADPAHPTVKTDLPIAGQIEQSRIVGDVLYVASRDAWWYAWAVPAGAGAAVGVARGGVAATPDRDAFYVESFDLRDPAHVTAVDRLEFPASGWDTHANVTSERATLSFGGWEASGPVTRFQIVDLSDPGGQLVAGAAFSTPGQLRDRWGMDYDASTGLFRAVLGRGGNTGADLRIWRSAAPGEVTPLSHLSIDVDEALTAARFDGTRAYAVTARQVDPLWVVDAADPAQPILVGQVHMPGQLDYVEPRGDRLVALGRTTETGSLQLTVTLIDVTKLGGAPLSRVLFGATWSWVAARPDDLRKAFIVVDPQAGTPGLVLVPLQGWDAGALAYAGGTQLVDYTRDGLALRGFLPHRGEVTRAFPLDAGLTRLASLSDSALQTIDAADRARPTELARLDLARPVEALAVVHGAAIELCGDGYRGASELAVTDALDPDAAVPLARLALGAGSARMFQLGDVLWILARDHGSGASWLEAVDASDPAHPTRRGRLDLAAPDAFDPRLGAWGWGWGYGDEAVLVGQALAVHRRSNLVGPCPSGSSCAAIDAGAAAGGEVRVYDLRDPDHPALASTVPLEDAAWSWGLSVQGTDLWLTHFTWQPEGELGRFWLDRIDLSDPRRPTLLSGVNVPGVFFAASADRGRIYTLEAWWEGAAGGTRLHALDLTAGGAARLAASLALPPATAAVSQGARAWITGYDPTAPSQQPGSSSPGATVLTSVDLGAMAVTDRQALQGWGWVRAAAGGKLFMQLNWTNQGLAVYGLTDPARPRYEQLVRTQGWVSDVVVSGGVAYLPSGAYGVPMVKLDP